MDRYDQMLNELAERCDRAGILYERKKVNSIYRDRFPRTGLSIQLFAGKSSHSIPVVGQEAVKTFLSIPFEKYRIIEKYLAICSCDDGYVEANVTVLNARGPSDQMDACAAIFGKWNREGDPKEHYVREFRYRVSARSSRVLLRLHPSADFGALRSHLGGNMLTDLVVQVWNPEIHTGDFAVQLLDSVVSSLFFQIDVSLGVPMRLTHPYWRSRYPKPKQQVDLEAFRFSLASYDQTPLDLYWFARSTDRMPLIQYLAYYQVLEYYMPSCAQRQTLRRVRAILKRPRFSPDSDSDVVNILNAVVPRRRSIGSERAQLRAVLADRISANAIRAFLSESKSRQRYFENQCDNIAPQRIRANAKDDELIQQVVDRIYQIRCRIIHTKGIEEGDQILQPLLPFSDEEHLLEHDFKLILFLARAAIEAETGTVLMP